MLSFGISSFSSRSAADALVLPYWEGKKALAAVASSDIYTLAAAPVSMKDFCGKVGETAVVYLRGGKEKRVILLGLGPRKEISVEMLRRAYSSMVALAHKNKWKDFNILVPDAVKELGYADFIRGASEGLVLTNYIFNVNKRHSLEKDPVVVVDKVTFVDVDKKFLAVADKALKIGESVYFTRDLINDNADMVTPQYLAKMALNLGKKFSKVKTTVFDKARIEKEKMGLLLAVNRGARHDPAFIIAEYNGAPKSNDKTVIVGKGITFDSGGLNLKPSGKMETMRYDMSGAAAALGTLKAVAILGLEVNVTVVIPSTENAIDHHSYKPGDVYISYSGKSVEIGNTDAEGRLILADALAYAAAKLKPTRIVSIATLTGAMVIALGHDVTGMMSNNSILANRMTKAGLDTSEVVWRLPIHEDYKELLKSSVGDIKNVGGPAAGSILSALFLKEFVGDVPWVHLDIAGTAFNSKAKYYKPENASGVGVRLLTEFLSL